MPPFLPTDPTLQLLLHVAGLALGWYLRHKGVSIPLLPAPVNVPTLPVTPSDRPVVDQIRKVLRDEVLPSILPLLEKAAAEAVANAKKG